MKSWQLDSCLSDQKAKSEKKVFTARFNQNNQNTESKVKTFIFVAQHTPISGLLAHYLRPWSGPRTRIFRIENKFASARSSFQILNSNDVRQHPQNGIKAYSRANWFVLTSSRQFLQENVLFFQRNLRFCELRFNISIFVSSIKCSDLKVSLISFLPFIFDAKAVNSANVLQSISSKTCR